ncbi:GNAT family N-acetyltransferase [Virgibacillus halodenitrificans]|uniref:GNAT family N-acetyltransferase n=1 Tax=Virgibacillus halodenitrificans TaxID=1482 RepID=UPI0002E06C80|nr:GNAT family N-acetyltransferase [Virgibacillus halodenitrificans]
MNKSEKVAIGTMEFKSPPDEMKYGEIGYDIVPAYQGKGYATEMANAVVQWAFQEKEITRITAECSPINPASVRVLEKIGMEHVSTTEEIMCWEILNKEYKC